MRIARVRHDFRFAFMVMSGFLIVGATATWHAVGYLSFTGGFFE